MPNRTETSFKILSSVAAIREQMTAEQTRADSSQVECFATRLSILNVVLGLNAPIPSGVAARHERLLDHFATVREAYPDRTKDPPAEVMEALLHEMAELAVPDE